MGIHTAGMRAGFYSPDLERGPELWVLLKSPGLGAWEREYQLGYAGVRRLNPGAEGEPHSGDGLGYRGASEKEAQSWSPGLRKPRPGALAQGAAWLQLWHSTWSPSGTKPWPTREVEQRAQEKQLWCQCRSSKDTYLPPPSPVPPVMGRLQLLHLGAKSSPKQATQ